MSKGASLAHSFGQRGPIAERIFAEGRRGWDPNYNSSDKQPVVAHKDAEVYETDGLAGRFGFRSKVARAVFARGRAVDCNPLG